ncbi:MAG: PA14 domain-containing protein [Polyangiaceae bacterium]|nr:PA14 domain-containing protein [Polyangiaceae bacterium]
MSSLNKKNLPILGRGLFLALGVTALVGCGSDGTTGNSDPILPIADGDATVGAAGKVRREWWIPLPEGDQFTKILRETTAKTVPPTGKDELTKLQADGFNADTATADFGSDFGERIRGFIKPPTTGTYYFGVSGDNQVSFFLSQDQSAKSINEQIEACKGLDPQMPCASAANGKHLAGAETLNPEFTPTDSFAQASQFSKPVTLDASKYYFFDFYHREGAGNTHAKVVWVTPGKAAPSTATTGADVEIVPGSALYYPDFPEAPAGGAAGAGSM